MTIEQQVDALTASVEDLKGAVVSKKATLDASVADVQSATAQAQAAKVNALSARDQAGAFKDAAYTAAQSAASAVAYQDLSAIALTKEVTAVDVFIYDTSKDSDGGAWRHRCAGTSWYREQLNTATRGTRREFPAIAVIVAEANRITIHDGDDPALPMWMVFDRPGTSLGILADGTGQTHTAITAIKAMNGKLFSAKGLAPANNAWGGITSWDLISEVAIKATTRSSGYVGTAHIPFSERNSITVTGLTFSDPNPQLVNDIANDLAVTVLPNAPIDPASKLPIPTIAVATAGGISVIKDDGFVVDIVHADSADTLAVNFDDDLLVYNAANYLHARRIPAADVYAGVRYVANPADTWFAPRIKSPLYTGSSFQLHPTGGFPDKVLQSRNLVAIQNNNRLNLARVSDEYAENNALAAFVTSSYTTGWMPGEVKAAFLASTEAIHLIGVDYTSDAFVLPDGWSWDGTTLGYDGTGTKNSRAYFPVNGLIGDVILSFNITVLSGGSIGVGFGNNDATATTVSGPINGTGGQKAWSFVRGANSSGTIYFQAIGSAEVVFSIEKINLQQADADRSVANNGLVVNGTISRAPVVDGAELMAYSGFSSNNFFEQNYNPELDFGTGDFCLMGWVFGKKSIYNCFLHRTADKTSSVGFRFMDGGGDKLLLTGSGSNLTSASAYPTSRWFHACAVRKNGVAQIFIDGRLDASGPWGGNLSTSGATLTIGGYWSSNMLIAAAPPMAMWRISASAPTADQIRYVFEDEKVLFQENAACTLFGASDAVTALAHDPDTGLLHVGTSAGRSVFKGLRRVANTTVPVGAAIAAAGGMIVDE